jgi:2-polyprenyl-3-methyl-5-hydroxy-6-metoxy-1,4-benzoquinol methylase
VKCNTCDLVRSDPTADPRYISHLYSKSHFDYSSEVTNLMKTYGRYLDKVIKLNLKNNKSVNELSLLEIGCGNGFFLEVAMKKGFTIVRGIEPSKSAIECASEEIKPLIVCDIMKPGVFPLEQFDVICMFQTLDHIPDPSDLIKNCYSILKPGGFILCFNHNIESLSYNLLKEKSPIIDIEHTFLFSPDTLSKLFINNKFIVESVGSASNTYSIRYLVRLFPLPKKIKGKLLSRLENSRFGNITLTFPFGNIFIIAKKVD